MAGPGGGPPRRSHTKSRKGCDTCKKRHIRCDESFPQCKNCTKHKIRCPYNDIPVQEARPNGPPDLMWTPEVEAAIEQWQLTGIFPFDLDVNPVPAPQCYSFEELRLIHHVASISSQLNVLDANGFTLWTSKIPTLIGIGTTHRFVMDALLAFSAEHLSSITGCPMVGKMAFEHRGHALTGLSTAINAFSQSNSDAVLGATLVLSWQATDWRSWTHHMQGTRGIIELMESWKDKSQFAEFMAETTTFPTAPPSPTPDHKPRLPSKDDVEPSLTRMLQHLQKLETQLKQNREDTKLVAQLVSFLKGTRKVDPALQVADQFERLKPLRDWLFWLPVMQLQQTQASPSALIIIAHYYAVALLMERMFPEIGAAYFGSLSIGPLEDISRRLKSISVSYGAEHHPELQSLFQLMDYATQLVQEFRSRMGWFAPAPPSPFGVFEDFSLPMPDGLRYAENPIFSYSTENLSIKTESSAPGVPVSPMAMPSPYSNQQYLNIPPPMNGCYSPVSSTCEASSVGDDFYNETSPVFYSDHEDFPSYDIGYAGTHSHLGGPYGVGTHSPFLSTTPTQQLPENAMFPSVPTGRQSPFLTPGGFSMLPVPESPVVGYSHPYSHNRHISTASAPPSYHHQSEERRSTP